MKFSLYSIKTLLNTVIDFAFVQFSKYSSVAQLCPTL